MAFITSIFDHASQAHEHLSSVCANISALAKITDRVTLHTVINGAVWPLVQINIPEGFSEPSRRQTAEDDRGRKMGEGPKDDPAHIKCTVLGPRAKERPHPCISSSGLVETEPQILQ